MTTRRAACCCGRIAVVCDGEPVRVAICHCRECQRRTGNVFSTNARFAQAAVTASGEPGSHVRQADSGNTLTFRFCRDCGTTVWWTNSGFPDVVSVAVGAFADPAFPPPRFSVHEDCAHPWVQMPESVTERR